VLSGLAERVSHTHASRTRSPHAGSTLGLNQTTRSSKSSSRQLRMGMKLLSVVMDVPLPVRMAMAGEG